MTPENFVYWLQGLFEIGGNVDKLDERQVKIVKEHLALVLKNVTNPPITISSSPQPFKFDWSGDGGGTRYC